MNLLKECYVIRVMTGKEKKFISFTERESHQIEGRIIWPRKSLILRKAGARFEKVSSLYPGYLFWDTECPSDKSIMILKKIPGFIRFLKSNSDIIPIKEEERFLLHNLISESEIIRRSNVVFDENCRIKVIDGPMKGLEGAIVKVDKRKCRARVQLTMHDKSLMVDLGFEVMNYHPEEVYPMNTSSLNQKSMIFTTS